MPQLDKGDEEIFEVANAIDWLASSVDHSARVLRGAADLLRGRRSAWQPQLRHAVVFVADHELTGFPESVLNQRSRA